ncbi:hypothetical protein HYALB_00003394 [Hymenoscyphus albidus]|uniref:Cytochrome P450 n=1 Tax=Hymenoscyphus albidus TaxID=595503 RepID=A0A9N9PW54_9HELO|nr:hypothetical protein HYALB_00003394 [Hymenoscyphus albidus]
MLMDSFVTRPMENIGKQSSVTWLFVAIVAYCIFRLTDSYLDYRRDTASGRQHGCQPPPSLVKRWPLGIEWLRKIWLFNAEGRLLDFFVSVAKEYEPINNVSQNLLLGPRAFHVMCPANVESVLATDFHDYGFGPRREVFDPLLGNGIFTQDGAPWKHSRELLRKQFVRAQYRNLDNFREHVDNLIAQIPFDTVVDLQPLFFSFTLDTTTALLFGTSTYSLRAGVNQETENKVFADSFSIAQGGLSNRFRIIPFHKLYRPKWFREACSNVHRFVDKYIEEDMSKSNEDENQNGFIAQVAKESATKKDLRDQLLNVLLAGRDTTACCLSWTFRLLIRNDMVMEKLRKEISSIMDSSAHPTREQIKRMPYLSCVIKESLRLYPPVPSNNRTAIRTTRLPTGGGSDGKSPILVRKGEMVTYGQYVISRLESVFGEDASEFHPERWENGRLADVGYAYFPFSGGPRQCLGEDFALMEISYTIVRMLQVFPVMSMPRNDLGSERQKLTLVLSAEDGCKVFMEKVTQ